LPDCGAASAKVHGFCERTVADASIPARSPWWCESGACAAWITRGRPPYPEYRHEVAAFLKESESLAADLVRCIAEIIGGGALNVGNAGGGRIEGEAVEGEQHRRMR
jgi:hypothetical protein